MKLDSALPTEFAGEYARISGNGDRPQYCCQSDLDMEGAFGSTYVAVDRERVVSFSPQRPVLELPLKKISEVKVEELFGSSRLVADLKDKRECLAWYSRDLVPEFATLCRVIEDLRQGREPVLPEQEEAARCRRCDAPLHERGASCPYCLSRGSIIRRLFGLMSSYKIQFIGLTLCSCLAVLAAMVPPYTYKMIADRVLVSGNEGELGFWIAVMLCSFIAGACFHLTANLLNIWLGARVVTDLRARLHERAQRLRMSYHNKHPSGQLVGRVMNDTGELQHFLADGLPYFFVNCLSFITIAIILLTLQWKLALIVFLPVPFLLLGGRFFWGKLRPLFHKHGHRIGSLHLMLSESLRGIRAIKSLNQEQRRSREYQRVNNRLFKVDIHIAKLFQSFFASMSLTMAIGTVLVWYFGGLDIIRGGETQLGTLLAFVGYMALFYGPLQWFTAVFSWMNGALAAAERIFSVLDQPEEVYESQDAKPIVRAKGRVEFRDVRFSYVRGTEVIKGISFEIAAGEMLGLVGRSGAGKSTIINLICRFYDADSGSIVVDGEDLKQLKLADWRKQIGIVMQDPFLFNASILDNIRYGNPEASIDDVVRAAEAAHAHSFICAKEEGYDTVIGEGVELSGGEKQRIAIARAILHDPPILILDEATSAVDSQTEKQIQEAIQRLVQGRTTIAIAHRLATLRNADRLVVIEEGKIIESGTHEELLDKEDGEFAKLVKLQTEINQLRAEQSVWQE